MPTLFTRIIEGELPGRFVWRDDRVVAFLPIALMAPGHTLVVPIEPIDHWIDLPPDLNALLWSAAQTIAGALQVAFRPSRVGVLIAGEEVPHAHVHLVPFANVGEIGFAHLDMSPDPADLDAYMQLIRSTLRDQGHGASVPND